MQLGIYLNSQHSESDDPARRFAETLEQVRLIRSLGFDSIWAVEHHANCSSSALASWRTGVSKPSVNQP